MDIFSSGHFIYIWNHNMWLSASRLFLKFSLACLLLPSLCLQVISVTNFFLPSACQLVPVIFFFLNHQQLPNSEQISDCKVQQPNLYWWRDVFLVNPYFSMFRNLYRLVFFSLFPKSDLFHLKVLGILNEPLL